ncbi:glycosyltransferase [Pantoea sp. BAV 3049]|uniref:glycosyltransferase n=1 Tax=Pantoea sp. BAV 3049 TaxID=2654188 RepID=UPI00131CAF80|nr:glycosyltransferase [Pantoea sp. BAV 3049]
MTQKLLSVVIPVDNAEKNVAHCLAALLRQSPVPDEIIIVHHQSDTATADALREISGQSGIVIAARPAGETQNLCDYGTGLAQSKWLYCCDPDGLVSDGFCADFTRVIASHPQVELFCFNTRTDETNPSFSARDHVVHRRHGLMTARQAFSDMLQNGVCHSATCNFVVQKQKLDSWQIMHCKPLCQDSAYTLEVFLRSGQAWVSDKCHYSLRSPAAVAVVSVKDEHSFRGRYDAFVSGYEKLTRLSEDSRASQELRRLYLIQSFKSMMQIAQNNGIQTPDFLFNAIHYFGRDLRAGSLTNWILLRKPELYNVLFRTKSGTAHV